MGGTRESTKRANGNGKRRKRPFVQSTELNPVSRPKDGGKKRVNISGKGRGEKKPKPPHTL